MMGSIGRMILVGLCVSVSFFNGVGCVPDVPFDTEDATEAERDAGTGRGPTATDRAFATGDDGSSRGRADPQGEASGEPGSSMTASTDSASSPPDPATSDGHAAPAMGDAGCQGDACGCDEGATRRCGSDVGICRQGVQTCEGGTWSECADAVEASEEVCDQDRRDEDCDGSHNEDCACEEGDSQPCGASDEGACTLGTQTCVDGSWSSECQGEIRPQAREICDSEGLDEDCDGQQNEGCTDNSGDPGPGDTRTCEPGSTRCDGETAMLVCNAEGSELEPRACPAATPVCIGDGMCVQCDDPGDCGAASDRCKVWACDNHTCKPEDKPGDYSSDANNCGSCGNRCGASSPYCQNGSCVECRSSNDCGQGETCRNGECACQGIASLSNEDHCGICGNRCEAGEECRLGLCQQPPCGNGRIDLGEGCDPAARGWTVETCDPNTCQRSTPPDPCEGVDLRTDQNNCGRCGVACERGLECREGVCRSLCGNGRRDAGEQCDVSAGSSEFRCDPKTCETRTLYTPCAKPSDCDSGMICHVGGFCTRGCSGGCEAADGYGTLCAEARTCVLVCRDGQKCPFNYVCNPWSLCEAPK